MQGIGGASLLPEADPQAGHDDRRRGLRPDQRAGGADHLPVGGLEGPLRAGEPRRYGVPRPGLAPVMRRSRSNIRATAKQAAQSTASKAPASQVPPAGRGRDRVHEHAGADRGEVQDPGPDRPPAVQGQRDPEAGEHHGGGIPQPDPRMVPAGRTPPGPIVGGSSRWSDGAFYSAPRRSLRAQSASVMAQFFGAPRIGRPRAGAGNLLSGTPLTGWRTAMLADAGPWPSARSPPWPAAWPSPMATRCRAGDGGACGGWLMLGVPPMIRTAAGPPFDSAPAGWAMEADHAAELSSAVRPDPHRQRYRHHYKLAAAVRPSGGCRWITKL